MTERRWRHAMRPRRQTLEDNTMPAPRTRSRDVLGALEDARAWEPRIEAWAYLAEPDELAAAWPATEAHGRLQGVPFAVKDIIDVAGEAVLDGIWNRCP